MIPDDTNQNLEEIQAQIEAIYNETMQKLGELETHKKEIIQEYIKHLEHQKIELIKKQLHKISNPNNV